MKNVVDVEAGNNHSFVSLWQIDHGPEAGFCRGVCTADLVYGDCHLAIPPCFVTQTYL
jgi:hypothetical protein